MKRKNIDKIQKDFRSKLGVVKANRHRKKLGQGKKNKQDRWGGLPRKEGRKAARKQKKEKMNAAYLSRFSVHHIHKPSEDAMPTELPVKKTMARKERVSRYAPVDSSRLTVKQKPAQKSQAEQKPKQKQHAKLQRDDQMASDEGNSSDEETEITAHTKPFDIVAAREEQQLRQLEKQLKMKKNTALPKSFMDDGLDYLLNVVDADKLKMMSDSEESDPESDSGDDDDEPEEMTQIKMKKNTTLEPTSASRTRKVRFADEVEEEEEPMEEGGDEEVESEEDGSGEEEDEGSEDESEGEMGDGSVRLEEGGDEDDDMKSDEEDGEDGAVREDIYGRLVDSKGKLVSTSGKAQNTAYIPPAKRAAMLGESGQRSLELERLKKQMKGLLNRASDSNMQSIANAVEDLYMSNSRASVNESLFMLITEAVVSTVLTPERLVAEMAMLVAVLHGNVGSEVGAYFLQQVTKRYEELRQQDHYGDEHTMDNILLLLVYLYNFKVAHHTLLFDIITQLVESFTEKDIELLLLILKSAGFYLRRDDPESLGNQITSIQHKARALEESATEVPARVRFMLEVLMAVRNNNVRRVPGADVERTDRLRRVAGTCIRGGSLADNQLNVGLQDLLQADQTGRWWIVGSAWEGRADDGAGSSRASAKASTATSVAGAVSQKLVRLAKKLRMNSDVRRSIFYVIMSSEDYQDAFQKVLQLGLKGQQEREIVVVAVECCKQESQFNPFYSHLMERLATHDRRFMMATQFHMWDMFKVMHETSANGQRNLALMLAHLLSSKALPLSVLKVLEFGALEKSMIKFLRMTMMHLLTSTSTSDLNLIFRRVGQLQKLRALSDGLRMFLTKYIKVKKLDGDQMKIVKDKLSEVCGELSLNRQTVL